MSQPAVIITELDGALGVLPASAGKLYALIGVSSAGPIDTPATFARVKDVSAAYGSGPLVEAACHYIDRYGKPVILVRTGNTTVGTVGTVTSTATGTSVVTVDVTPPATPADDYELFLKFIAGGTVGTAGITYQTSLDGGRTLGPVTALGTATSIPIAGSGGVSFELAAGTVVAGDTHKAVATAPQWNNTELKSALDALGATAASWDLVHVVGALTAGTFQDVDDKIVGLFASGKYHGWVGHCRMPNAGESEALYLGAMSTAFADKASKHGMLCAGASRLSSAVNGRKYRRPSSYVLAARNAAVSEEVNIADVNTGALSASIRDVNGNPEEHDESVNPGLDDARFAVLRTWDGYQGVYCNRPRLFAPSGSDFQIMPYRRVINLCHAALRVYFIRRLNKPILVSKTTGFILESEALEIEAGALAIMRGELLVKPKASECQFTLARNDNVLSNKTLNGEARIIPLAYPEWIYLSVGYVNPALQVSAV
jgi:hypothetical protein